MEPEHTTVDGPQEKTTSVPEPRAAFYYRRDDLFAGDVSLHDVGDPLGDSWSVPWSDLMMVMFVLFAALVTAQSMHREVQIQYQPQPQPQPQPEIREIEKQKVVEKQVPSRQPSFEPLMKINVFERSRQAIQDADLSDVEIAILEDQSVMVSVQGPMFFELGKADLRQDIKDFLDALAHVIKQTPYEVHVIGHTDDYPINTDLFPSNWELSLIRASRVARYLIDSGHIDPARFIVMGRGEYAPAVPNKDDKSRALNRRVEIIITREVGDPKA